MSEADKPRGVACDRAGQGVVAAAGGKSDPIDAVAVELGQPAIGDGFHGLVTRFGLGLGEIPGQTPGGAVALSLTGRGRDVAFDREVGVEVDDVEILKHRFRLVAIRSVRERSSL